ncbi:unnamed protein product [Sphenostylis stenocarpa]|uniref:Uncharacterized protein n=1 Tax=Sphenostylis stenocarpa TaxID=92480 RepID=A0AA86SV78_9FABA|nr:unnamed protein product [Sphenostylis stenocarpa]
MRQELSGYLCRVIVGFAFASAVFGWPKDKHAPFPFPRQNHHSLPNPLSLNHSNSTHNTTATTSCKHKTRTCGTCVVACIEELSGVDNYRNCGGGGAQLKFPRNSISLL